MHPRASQRRLDGAIDRGGSLSRGRVVIEDDSLLVGDNHSEVAVVPHLQHRFPHQSRDGMRPPQKPIDYHDHMHREIARLPGGALHGSLYHWELSLDPIATLSRQVAENTRCHTVGRTVQRVDTHKPQWYTERRREFETARRAVDQRQQQPAFGASFFSEIETSGADLSEKILSR